jgi:hypothetical protein
LEALMALNANHEIERLKHAEDRFADRVTDFAGVCGSCACT